MASIVTAGKVISVEAVRDNYRIALANRHLNDTQNWEILNAAIWDKADQELIIARSSRQANAIDFSLVGVGSEEKVSTTSINALSTKCESVIDLLSLTVNGAEVEAIRGMLDMQRSSLPKRILCPGWYTSEGVVGAEFIRPLLNEMGYKIISTPGNFLAAWLPE